MLIIISKFQKELNNFIRTQEFCPNIPTLHMCNVYLKCFILLQLIKRNKKTFHFSKQHLNLKVNCIWVLISDFLRTLSVSSGSAPNCLQITIELDESCVRTSLYFSLLELNIEMDIIKLRK